MSGEDEPRRRGRKPFALSGEDRELWRHVTRSVAPNTRKRRVPVHPVPEVAGPAAGEQPVSPPPCAPTAQPRPPATKAGARSKRVESLAPVPVAPEHPQPMDRRNMRRFAKGQHRIEARIDLHGMRQSEAHGALRAFLLRSHAAGLRHVLVITGKGTPAASTDDWQPQERERGVLRRNVPRWLAEPELAAVVSATAPAHVRHGGDGALYVTLRGARHRREQD